MTVTTPTEWTTADWKQATDKAATLAAALPWLEKSPCASVVKNDVCA